MSPVLANESELYVDRGGPTARFMRRLFLRWGIDLSATHRIVAFLIITWVPLLLFAMLEGRAFGSGPKESLLQDFGTYARFFLAVPLLILAESIVGPRLTGAGLNFVQGGFVRPEDYPAFDRAIARVKARRESYVAELIILGVAILGSWVFTFETVSGETIATWRSPNLPSTATGISLTALWYRCVATPILQFFWYRWLWRLAIWAGFLWTVSRLNLNLIGTHADQAGGLGFLGTAHMSLGIFALTFSSVLSAEAAFLVVFEKVDIETFKFAYIALLVFVELFFLGPLLMFIPIMAKTRLAWLRDYSLLVDRYNRSFHEKWVLGKSPADKSLLGSSDIQSLADLGNSFQFVRGMSVIPISLRVALQFAIVTSLPCVPLILLVVPIDQILGLLTKAVF